MQSFHFYLLSYNVNAITGPAEEKCFSSSLLCFAGRVAHILFCFDYCFVLFSLTKAVAHVQAH